MYKQLYVPEQFILERSYLSLSIFVGNFRAGFQINVGVNWTSTVKIYCFGLKQLL